MKVLSVLQPWAHLLVHGHKDVENRRWRTSFRGPVLIHAGKTWGADQRADLMHVRNQFRGIELPDAFSLGGIVGMVDLYDCVSQSQSPWFNGPYGFLVRDAQVLTFTPCRGALNFFDLPAGVDIEIPERQAAAPKVEPPRHQPLGMVERGADSVGLGTMLD